MIGSAIRLTAVGGILCTVLVACAVDESELGTGPSSTGAIVASVPVLHDLSGVDEIKTAFNQDMGQPRVFLLLSPT